MARFINWIPDTSEGKYEVWNHYLRVFLKAFEQSNTGAMYRCKERYLSLQLHNYNSRQLSFVVAAAVGFYASFYTSYYLLDFQVFSLF